MSGTVSDFVIQRLHEWGVRQIYGYPGDGINGLMGALRRAEGTEHGIQFVQTRHEEVAAFMAAAHAKFTEEVGVCLATSGPGAIHLLNGLYDAALDHQPVVALVGQQARTAMGTDYQQEVDLISLFKDVAKDYVHMCTHPASARHLVDRAMRIAKADKAVTCVIFPNDIQEMDAQPSPPRTHGAIFTGVGYSAPKMVPHEEDLKRAADVLNSGEKVGILVGQGAMKAADEVTEVMEVLGAGAAKALLGKAVLPDDQPGVTGAIGLLGTRPSDDMIENCDTFLMIGSGFPYSEWLPKEGQARGVQIDIQGRMLGLRYPMEVNLHGDARHTLQALLPMLDKKPRKWREEIEENVADWWKILEERAMQPATPINPQRLFWELSPRLPENAVLTADSGSSANWWARDFRVRKGMRASLSGNLATMGPGVPYALAAKFTHPDLPVVAAVGDGAMQMIGNNALMDIARYWEAWDDPRLIVLVLNNRDLNQVTWEQRVMEGDPKYRTSQVLPEFSFADYARQLGLDAVEIKREEEIVPGIEQALKASKPVVIDAQTDPEVPPLPPHIRFEQAKGYLQALFKGDPRGARAIKQSLRDLAATYKPKK